MNKWEHDFYRRYIAGFSDKNLAEVYALVAYRVLVLRQEQTANNIDYETQYRLLLDELERRQQEKSVKM